MTLLRPTRSFSSCTVGVSTHVSWTPPASDILRPINSSTPPVSFTGPCKSAKAMAASCAALSASMRTSWRTLSVSRRDISAFRFARSASSVADTCRLYRFSHLAVNQNIFVRPHCCSPIFRRSWIEQQGGGGKGENNMRFFR